MAHHDKTPEAPEAIAARFLRETAHLGPEGQRRVLAAIKAANRCKQAREQTIAAIKKAAAN